MGQEPISRFLDLLIPQHMVSGRLGMRGRTLRKYGARYPWMPTLSSHIPPRSIIVMNQVIVGLQDARFYGKDCGGSDPVYPSADMSTKEGGLKGYCGIFRRPMSSIRNLILVIG